MIPIRWVPLLFSVQEKIHRQKIVSGLNSIKNLFTVSLSLNGRSYKRISPKEVNFLKMGKIVEIPLLPLFEFNSW